MRARRSVIQAALEPLQRFGLAFRGHFHVAVRRVPHPAENPLAGRRRFREVTEADTLHPTDNDIAPRNDHDARAPISYRAVSRVPRHLSRQFVSHLVTTTNRVGGT